MTSADSVKAYILVADHDETLRELLDVSLTQAHHTVRQVSSGREALSLMQSEFFDLAIIELSMPDITALEILTRLKASQVQVPHTMILSGESNLETIKECVGAGAKDFVVKPFSISVLIKRIEVILQKVHLDQLKK